MADIILGNNFKIYYNTDTGNSSLQGINNVLIDNLAAFPTLTISTTANQFDTYDSEYLTTLLSEQTLEPLSITIHYVPDNSTAMFLDEMADSHDEFQIVMVYDFNTSAETISGAIVNGRISSYSTTGDKDEVLTRTYTFIHSDVVMRAMTVTASVPITQGDYGIGSNTTDIAQYQPDVPTGNSFIKVPAAQVGNPTGTDLMGIGLVDGTNVAEFAMTKSGTLSLFAKNANTAWTRIYTVTQMDSTYVPLTRTVNGKPLSGNVVLNASDLAGGTMTGALTVPALTVTGTTTLRGNTAATVVTATSLTSTGSTATDSLSVSGTTALAGVTTAGTINASTLNVSGNTVHTGTTKLNGVTTAGTVNAGATTATSLSVSGDTTHTGTTKLTGVTTAGTVNAGATTATSLSVSGDTTHTGTTTLTGLTTAGTVNAEALTVSGNTTHTGTTTLTGTTTAGTVNAGATTATSLSVSGDTSLEDVTAGTVNASTVNASDLTLINALPVTQGGTGNTNGTVGQLTTARTFVTNLASTTAASFNGTANNSHGVTGILPISNGGTGNNTGNAPTATLAASANVLSTARNITTDLGSTTAASFNGSANITPGVSGVLPITSGGTGAITPAAARTNLGIGTAAQFNVGNSGNVVPLLNGANSWSQAQAFPYITLATAVELGSTTNTSTPFIDFHSSGNNIDYDSRIIATGGNSNMGQGDITIVANNVAISKLALSNALTIANGGTGATTVAAARSNLGLGVETAPWFAGLELIGATPVIDFHYNNTTTDYTARIIHAETNALEVTAATGNISFRVNGGIRVGGANYAGGLNIFRGNGDPNALWGLNCSDGNLNFVRGDSAGGTIMMGDSFIQQVRGIRGKQGSIGSYQGNTWQFYWNTSSQLEAWIDTSNVGIVSLSSTSDRGLKKDIVYITDTKKALSEVLLWEPAVFKMKERGIIPETENMLGFIANDLIAVSPECVGGKGLPEDYDIEEDPNNPDAYYLNQVPMIAKLTQAIQAQQHLIEELSSRVKYLEDRQPSK